MKYPICAECVYRRETQRVCAFCDEGDQFEEDPRVAETEAEPDDGDAEGFGL